MENIEHKFLIYEISYAFTNEKTEKRAQVNFWQNGLSIDWPFKMSAAEYVHLKRWKCNVILHTKQIALSIKSIALSSLSQINTSRFAV